MVLGYPYEAPLFQSKLVKFPWGSFQFDLFVAKLPTDMVPSDPMLLVKSIETIQMVLRSLYFMFEVYY